MIAFLLPAGGAALTVRNLHRLGQLDDGATRQLTLLMVGVCAIGYSLLFSYGTQTAIGPQPDVGALSVLQFGVALACFSAQRAPFRLWRSAHPRAPTSTWLTGIGVALLYMVVTLVAILPIYGITQAIGIGH